MKIEMIGVNHETATVDFREKMSMTEAGKIEFMNRLLELPIQEVVLVSTCGRIEVYYAYAVGSAIQSREEVPEQSVEEQLLALMSHRFSVEALQKHVYVKKNEDCVLHLMRVASGLDSAVLGEDQILGQVKDAQQFAMDLGASGKVLNKLFREAISAAKAIKTELKISEHPLSLSYIGIKKAKHLLGTLEGKTVTMVGLGKMGQLALKSLVDEGVATVYAAVRTPCKLDKRLFDSNTLQIVSFDDRHKYVEMSDLVISATAAPHPVIRLEQIRKIKEGCVFLDLALPRDVEPQIGEQYDVTILDVDDLKDISEDNQALRAKLAEQAEQFLVSYLEDYMKWLEGTHVDKVVHIWHDEIDQIHEDTMNYLKRRLSGVDSRSMGIIDKMVMSSMKRFIRKPLSALKHMEDSEARMDAVRLLEELFSYEEEE